MNELRTGLRGPVEVALARVEENIPTAARMPGGANYELKWDGYRVAVVRDERGAQLWSRQGKDLTDRFPDLQAAATKQLRPGTVLDGEAVIWNGARLDFDHLQRRLATTPKRAAHLIAEHPASLMVFDLLAHEGADLRSQPLRQRRATLEKVAQAWRPPLQLSPATMDEATARQWFTDYRPAGIEGLVVKGLDTAYHPGRRIWVKVKSRETTEIVIGAVTGTLQRPDSIIGGLIRDGELRIIGRPTPLSTSQASAVASLLTPAGPDHPWPDEIAPTRFGTTRAKVAITKVEPLVVAEVLADTALQAGTYRHPPRFVRPRLDRSPDELTDPTS